MLGFEVKLKVKKFGQTVFDVMYIEFSMNCIFSDSCPPGSWWAVDLRLLQKYLGVGFGTIVTNLETEMTPNELLTSKTKEQPKDLNLGPSDPELDDLTPWGRTSTAD